MLAVIVYTGPVSDLGRRKAMHALRAYEQSSGHVIERPAIELTGDPDTDTPSLAALQQRGDKETLAGILIYPARGARYEALAEAADWNGLELVRVPDAPIDSSDASDGDHAGPATPPRARRGKK